MEDGLSPLNAIDFEHNTEDPDRAELSSRAKKRLRPPKATLSISRSVSMDTCFPRFNYRNVPPQICALLMNLDDCASAMPSLCDICAAGSSPRPSSRPPRFQFPSQGKQNDGIDIPSIFDL